MRGWIMLGLVVAVFTPAASGAEVSIGAGATFDVGSGTIDLGCTDLDVAGNFDAGTGTTAGIRDVSIAPTGLLDGAQGSLTLAGGWDNTGTFDAGTGSVFFLEGCGLSSASVFGSTTFATVSFVTGFGKTISFESGSTQTITGALTLLGAPGSKLVLRSTAPGLAASIDLSGTQVISDVDVEDVHGTGLALLVDPDSMLGQNTLGWAFLGAVPSLGLAGATALALILVVSGVRRRCG